MPCTTASSPRPWPKRAEPTVCSECKSRADAEPRPRTRRPQARPGRPGGSNKGGLGFRGFAELIHHVDHSVNVPDQPERNREQVLLPLRRGLHIPAECHYAIAYGHSSVLDVDGQKSVNYAPGVLDDLSIRAKEDVRPVSRIGDDGFVMGLAVRAGGDR